MKQKTVYTFNVKIKEGEVETNYTVGFLQPKRSEKESSELFYSKRYNALIDEGIMPAAVMQKKFLDAGVTVDPQHVAKYSKVVEELTEKNIRYQTLLVDLENKERNKNEIETLIKEIAILNQKIKEFEACRIDSSSHTAEGHAFDDVVRWLVLRLAVVRKTEDETSEFSPLFKGERHEDRLADLDAKEEAEDKIYIASLNNLYKIGALVRLGVSEPDKIKEYLETE